MTILAERALYTIPDVIALLSMSRSDSGHGKLPGGGHVAAR